MPHRWLDMASADMMMCICCSSAALAVTVNMPHFETHEDQGLQPKLHTLGIGKTMTRHFLMLPAIVYMCLMANSNVSLCLVEAGQLPAAQEA